MEVRGALPPQQPLLKENQMSEVSTCPQHSAGLGFKCWGEGGGKGGMLSGFLQPSGGRGRPGLRVQACGHPGAEVRTTGVSPGQP